MNRTTWQPVTIPAYDPRQPRQVDPRDRPLDLVLTPSERDRAKLVALDLERNRRLQNARDAAQTRAALAREAERALSGWLPERAP